jgi:DNA primase
MSSFVRFDEAFLGRIRAQVDLPALIGKDMELRRAGPASFKACCPFHAESTPSFFVKRDGFFRCYGCGKTGDAIEWLRAHHGLSFHEAATELARSTGIALPPAPELPEEARQQLRANAQLRAVLEEAARIFRHGFARRRAARTYLADVRGLDVASVTKFELGVVGVGVTLLLSRYSRERIVDAGLAITSDDGITDRFTQRIMLPIRNRQGALVSFAGRLYLPDDRREAKYLNGPETALFHKSDELYGMHQAHRAIRRTRAAVVVEGYFDVISLHQLGEDRAVAPMGTALASRQAERLLQSADQLFFAYDADGAGHRAAASAARMVLQHMRDGQSASFVALPDGQDPDSFARVAGRAGWNAALAAATPLSQFLASDIVHGLDMRLVEARVTAAQRANDVLQRIEHAPLFRRSLQQALEAIVGISLE